VPTFLTIEQEECVLASTDRSTPRGRRDYAILLLLARLGLRTSEIVSLELGDIRWRSGELVVHGKGQMVEHVPLLSDVGEALAIYLHEDRGASASRRVFCECGRRARWLGGAGGDRPYSPLGLRSCRVPSRMPGRCTSVPQRLGDDDDSLRRVHGGDC
jgi:integrase